MEPAFASHEYRLLFFCPVAGRLAEGYEHALSGLLDRLGAPAAELVLLRDVGALKAKGWQVLLLRSSRGETELPVVASALQEVTETLSDALQSEVLGLFVDAAQGEARICRCEKQEQAQTFDGKQEATLPKAAEWLEVSLASLDALVQLGPEEEVDPEDRFVADKLEEARVQMRLYRQEA